MYNYNYGYNPTPSVAGSAVWTIIAAVLALVGGIVIYCIFLKPDKKVDNKVLIWAKEFFNFKKMLIEDILKVLYIILAIFLTLYSFNLIAFNFLAFLLVLVLGNVLLRLVFEGSLMLIMIWKNTSEINKKMK